MKWAGLAAGVLVAGCVPHLTGAPCHADNNCPASQYCDGAHCQAGPPPPTRVTQLLVTTPAEILPLGSTVQATATAVLQSGDHQDVTATASWSSSNDLVAQVSNDAGAQGTVLALATGEVDVTATLGANAASAHLVVTNAELVSLVVTVDRPVVAPRTDVAATATGFFTDGTHADLTSLASWNSSQPGVVSVSTSPGSVGSLVALASGTALLQASYQQHAGAASVTVTHATLQQLAVSPLLPYVTPATSTALQATGLFSDGTAQPMTGSVQWTVDDPSLAFFLSSVPGQLQGFSAGQTDLEAQVGTVVAQVPLVVSAASLAGLEVSPVLPDPLGVLGAADFTTWGTFGDDGVLELTTQASWSSTVPDVLAVSASAGTASALDAGVSSVQASFDGLIASAVQTVDGARPALLLVWPPEATLTVGLPGTLAAERVFSDAGVDDATGLAGWTSSCPLDVQVSTGVRGGALTARAPKTCTIAAALAGLSGSTAVTATARAVQRLEVNPSQVAMGPGGWAAFTATAIFGDGSLRDVTSLAAWSSANADVLAAGSGPQAGQALAVDGGISQLTATFGDATASAPITISPAPGVPALEVWPPLLQLHAGTERPLSATAVWPTGDALDVTAWTVFSSSDVLVASVANAAGRRGQLAALSPGRASITAAFGPAATAASVAVDAAAVDALAVVGPASLPAGEPDFLRAQAHFLDGSQMDVTSQASFTSSPTSFLRVRGTGPQRGTAVALAGGTTTAQARFGGTLGAAQVATTPGGVQSLSIQGLPTAVPAGVQLQLAATAGFPGPIPRDVTPRAVWTSSVPQVASVSSGQAGGVLATATPGSAQLTASFGGSTASTSVNVTAAVLTGLSILPAGPTGPVGVEVPLRVQGTYSDGTQLDLTAQARWSSASPALLAVSNGERSRGAAMALAPGSTTVSAFVLRPDGSVLGTSAPFVGGPALPVGVEIAPASVVLSLSGKPTLAVQARAHLSDGTTRDVSTAATWAVQAADIAQVTALGALTAFRAGSTNVSATYGSVTGSAPLTVVP